MDSMATGAVGHCLRSALGGESVERCIEGCDAVGRQSKASSEFNVAMAMRAGFADVGGADWRIQILGREDVMFAVAVRADRRLADALFDGFAMDADLILFGDFDVAHAASVRHCLSEFWGEGSPGCLCVIMRIGVAYGAIRRGCVSIFYRLAMHAGRVGLGDVLMAGGAIQHLIGPGRKTELWRGLLRTMPFALLRLRPAGQGDKEGERCGADTQENSHKIKTFLIS